MNGEDIFVFTTLRDGDSPPRELHDKSIFTFREAEGTTFVLPRHVTETLGYQYEFPSKMITLEVHSSLSAVGFLAVILKQFANHGVPCNVASGYYHDHLFVPLEDAEKSMEILHNITLGLL